MLKRHGSLLADDVAEPRSSLRGRTVLKRHCSRVELLPHDVVELILERLPVKSLMRFKSVSKKWKLTTESRYFQERQLIRRRQSPGPEILFVSLDDAYDDADEEDRIVLTSPIVCSIRFSFPNSMVCYSSCDGLVCLNCLYTPNTVVNPATRWHQRFPLSCGQQLIFNSFNKGKFFSPTASLGFGKDKFRGTYKPVWLHNSSEFGLDHVTTCEVFDFSTNAWRYVLPASPYRLLPYQKPVYFDGSLHWFTEGEETNVLSFDLHTETFQVIAKAPFAHVSDPNNVIFCVLNNRLCVSQQNWPTQVIWSFENKTWKILCSLDLTQVLSWFGCEASEYALLPLAILEKNKLLLHGRLYLQPLVTYDLHTKSYDLVFKPTTNGDCLHYFQSLLSV